MTATKVSPIVGVADAILDLTGVKDKAFEGITELKGAIDDKIDAYQADQIIM